MRYDERDNHLYLIEMNPRFWGSLTASVRAGTNFPDLICTYALSGTLGKSHQDSIRFASSKMIAKCVLQQRLGAEPPLRIAEMVTADSFSDPGLELLSLLCQIGPRRNPSQGSEMVLGFCSGSYSLGDEVS